MSDGFGITQHARGTDPDHGSGTCVDDVARALVVDLDHADTIGARAVEESVRRAVEYLYEAFDRGSGRFRNLRSSDGHWLDLVGSEDCHGRAMLALSQTQSRFAKADVRRASADLLERALPAAIVFSSIRAMSSAAIACSAPADHTAGFGLAEAARRLGDRLLAAFRGAGCSADWAWPEQTLTYESALPAQALIAVGERLGDAGMTGLGLSVLDWLLRNEIGADGKFNPVGNRGWWSRGGARAEFDQQPIEAWSASAAAEAAYAATSDSRYADAVERAYSWFLGGNSLGLVIADPATGGCRDGIGADGVNQNQGAESTLAWLSSLESVRRVRRAQHVLDHTR